VAAGAPVVGATVGVGDTTATDEVHAARRPTVAARRRAALAMPQDVTPAGSVG